MTMMRVATFAMNDQMIASALRTQSVMANEQIQEASGVTSSDYGGLGETSGQVINLQISVTRSESYGAAATAANSKVQVMSSTMTSITDLLSNLKSTLTGATNSASSNATAVTQTAQADLQEMASLLNTQFEGQYVFGGSDTNTAPVNVSSSAYPAATSPSSPSTSYYQGNDQIASVQVSQTQTVSYGVTADNTAFEQGLRALNLVANNSPLSTATLNEAMNLTTSAITAATNVQTGLGLASASLESASAAQTDYQNYAQTLGNNLSGVDVAAVTAQLATYDDQLSASYSAIAKIQGLSLASFLH
jgi:flagellar hook-associated protein 3 FlgL